MPIFNFMPADTTLDLAGIRRQVRDFLQATLSTLSPLQRAHSWTGFDADFSRKLGEQGWIGMQWPKRYQGQESSALERHAVIEELLAAGAPVGTHWIADRQSGNLLLRYADEKTCEKYLPGIASGELCFCIGMSEPNAGSDLAAIRSKAKAVEGGWLINGSKLWTTNVDKAQIMIALIRTGKTEEDRHQGLSQFLIDLSLPGITIRPIVDQTGEKHFGEVFFDDVFVSDDCLIGVEGEGWQQVTTELSLERSGPERYLSSYRLLEDYIAALDKSPPQVIVNTIGEISSELWALRHMSLAVVGHIAEGNNADLEATIVKDMGACFEQDLPHRIQAILDDEIAPDKNTPLKEVLHYLLNAAPSFSLRGGTREVLRGIIARKLSLR